MAKATVRDLRYGFSRVEDLLREGEEIQITKRGKPVARLIPVREQGPARRPDFLARLKEIYGNKKLEISGADLQAGAFYSFDRRQKRLARAEGLKTPQLRDVTLFHLPQGKNKG